MKKELFIIEYECAHWCGGNSCVVVWAENKAHAEILAEYHMDESMRELFSDEYNDEDGEEYDQECAYTVNSVEFFDEKHEQWKYFCDPSQAEFYPVIGEPN